MAREVADGADGLGQEQNAIAVAARGLLQQPARQPGNDAGPGQFVVGHRGMADISGKQDFPIRLAGDAQLAVSQTAGEQFAVDMHPVVAGRQALALTLADAETPAFFVVGGDVGNRIRRLRQGMQVGLQFRQRHFRSDGRRVAHQVQVVGGEIDHLFARRVLHPGFAHPPFARHGPVETGAAAGDFMHPQAGQVFAQYRQGLPHPVAAQAAIERPEPARQGVHGRTWFISDWHVHHGRAATIKELMVTLRRSARSRS